MRIASLAKLIGAKMLNEPLIKQIDGFSFISSKVARQNAYFDIYGDLASIHQATQNGAYCIISELDIIPFDNEIAFIKVDDLRLSIYRLMRYFATQKELKFAQISNLQLNILKHINADFSVLCADLIQNFNQIQNASAKSLFFTTELNLLEKITFCPLKIAPQNAKIIKQNSLFFSDFIFNNERFSLQFPNVFVNELCEILGVLTEQNIAFRLKDFKDFTHFKALFVSTQNQPAPFGASARAFICENDKSVFKWLCAKLKNQMLFCVPPNFKKHENTDYFSFSSLDDLKNLRNFTYALVLCDYDELFKILSTRHQNELLF